MKVSAIAARYSRAFFELAKDQNAVEETMNDMNLVHTLCNSSRELTNMLKSPVIKTDKKQSILKKIFGDKVSKLTMTYLLVITRKRREAFIHEIAAEFAELYKDYMGILTTRLMTAAPASDDIRNEVKNLMKKHKGKKIDLAESVNEDLVGGYILQWEDKQYDASILNQINKLKRGVTRVNLYTRKV
jgi:F-type H+-transporting ATPase subunit delta